MFPEVSVESGGGVAACASSCLLMREQAGPLRGEMTGLCRLGGLGGHGGRVTQTQTRGRLSGLTGASHHAALSSLQKIGTPKFSAQIKDQVTQELAHWSQQLPLLLALWG